MEEIKKHIPEAIETLEAAGIDEETLLSFSREDIKDLFDGPENFLMRRKIWQIIDAHRDQENSNLVASVSDASAEISTMPSHASTPKSRGNATIDQGETIIKTSSPAFMLYSDSELAHAATQEEMSPDLMNRLVRNTIANMRTSCQTLSVPREPTSNELKEMATALSKKYKSFDKEQKDGKSTSDILYQKLKKRLANVLPTKKPQGKIPARAKKAKLELPESIPCLDTTTADDTTHADEIDSVASSRHYDALNKEQRKKKPNKNVINKYLNLEFESRRRALKETKIELRPKMIFDMYPCFKDPVEVVEEVRRTLGLHVEENVDDYFKTAILNLKSKLDSIIYFGISRHSIDPPASPLDDSKMLHLLTHINCIFKSKGKSKMEIIHVIEDDEEPDEWQSKRPGSSPGLLISRNGAMVLLGKNVLCSFERNNLVKATVCFLAAFYVLDLDYPANWISSLSFLQKLVFGDRKVHPNAASELKKSVQDFENFCFLD